MKNKILSILAAVFLVAGISTSTVVASNNTDHKITICHRTNSVTNPYTNPTVDFDAATGALKDNGQGDHTGHTGPVFDPNTVYPTPHNGDQWGDIIPPYTWNGGGSYPGLNWTTAGQAIWNNGCKPVTPTVPQKGSITVVKHLVPTNDPGKFDLKVGNDVVASNVGNNGQGTKNDLSAGSYTVSEVAHSGTTLSNYTSALSCTNEASGTTSATFNLAEGEDVTCTFTNTIKGGQGGEDQDVTLCHSADGTTFTKITVSAATAYNPHYISDINDIIPAFSYNGQSYAAKNWTTANQAVYNNNCVVGGSGGGTTTTTTTTTPTVGGQGAEAPAPTGGVGAGFGGGSQAANLVSMFGLLGSLATVGFSVRRLGQTN